MIHRIVSTALAQPILVLLGSVALIAVGIWSFSRLPIDAYPDLSPPIVSISTQWAGQAAEEIEREITVPIETELNGIPGVHVLRSVSFFGLSSVDLTFDDGVDPYFARQQVFERLADVTLPDGVSAGVEPLFSPSGLVYRYVLESPDRSPMELKTLNDWLIAKAYKSVKGVADMSGFGGPTMEYHVVLDPTKIAGAGLAVSDVVDALDKNNSNAGGGFYSEGGQFYYVRGLGRLQTPEDIGNVVLAVRGGTPILIRNVGRVEIGNAPRTGLFGFNKNSDAVEGVILMRTGEQAQTVLKGVQAKTVELNSSVLPKDVRITP
ncbi:MAG: efflux RND transporter permease subunit, partial [Gemmatimonadales bacterium]